MKMTDSDLLYEQVRLHPDDTVLLSAWLDCLMEDGDARAEPVRELLETVQGLREHAKPHTKHSVALMHQRNNLMWRLRIRKLEVNESVCVDEEGRVVPVWARDYLTHLIVGRAMDSSEGRDFIRVWLDPMTRPYGHVEQMFELGQRL